MSELVELNEQEWWDQVIEPSCQRFLGMSGSQFMELTETEREALNEKDHCDYIQVEILCHGYRDWYNKTIKDQK